MTMFSSMWFGSENTIVIDITSNTFEQNILTLAEAKGYVAATSTSKIIVNIASGVTVLGLTTYSLRTGALNADSDVVININGNIDGYTGTSGGLIAVPGSAGGDAIYWETNTGGSGSYSVNVASGASVRSGGGGGGGGGNRGALFQFAGKYGCDGSIIYGSYGSTGAAGGFGEDGTQGSSGTYGAGEISCVFQPIGAGGAGGAAGYALRKNGRTITVNNSGTILGTVG